MVVENFQKQWDLETDDLEEMLNRAFLRKDYLFYQSSRDFNPKPLQPILIE